MGYSFRHLLIILFFCFLGNAMKAQCPNQSFSKLDLVNDVSFDNFAELISGKTFNAFSISVTNTDDPCPWDLYVTSVAAPITQLTSYSPQGIPLPVSAINIRAVNACATPNQEYPDGSGIRPIPAISGNFNPCFTIAGDHYVVGSVLPDLAMTDNEGACDGLVEINDNGTPFGNQTTHTFRFDLQIIPGVAPIIQPGVYRLDISITLADDVFGPLPGSPLLYSITIEILPILQLQMNSQPQIDFDFTEIKDYNAGIINYGATKLNINSSVNWDLMAVATSTRNENSAGVNPYWDNSVSYSAVGSLDIPLDVLELYQSPANPTAGQSGAGLDYSVNFTNPPSQDNNIEVAYGAGVALTAVAPYTLGKTIAGNWGASGAGNMMTPGSYITINGAWNRADFSYVISYRLIPGLPARFQYSRFPLMATDARPGVYSMQVKYILVEDF